MADDLVFIGFVLVFFKEIRSAGKCDLVDILFYLVRCHAKAVICDRQCLFVRVHGYQDLRLVIRRQGVFSHHVQFFQFGNGVAAVGY